MYISRIATDGREQPTVDHLEETASYAGILGGKFSLPALARTAALLHDMGKFSNDFLEYLKLSVQFSKGTGNAPRRGSVIHATQGAKHIYEAARGEGELLLAAEAVAICVAGHHGVLMDGVSPLGETPLRNRLTTDKEALHYEETRKAFEKEHAMTENLQALLSACRDELSAFIEICESEHLTAAFMFHLLVKSIYSCLVDSDRYNANCFEIETTPEALLSIPLWEEYAMRLEQSLSAIVLDSEIAHIRNDISETCLKGSRCSCGVYRLDVPTGGGKTLSSLRFALNHAREHGMEHIIYVIPYLSVLEQTAKEIKAALQYQQDENFILEHHSNLVPPDDENEAQAYRLFTDRWNQPIIITTLVQFLESVYSHTSSNLRKFHNMANAVLIFDEVQSLPVKCVHLFNDALNYLHAFGNSTIVLCTATQPLIDKVVRPIRFSQPCELVTDKSEAFKKLKRTRIVDSTVRGGYTNEALRDFVLDKLDTADNCLVILNTKKDVANLYRAIKTYTKEDAKRQIRPVHLSTSMCPAHRMEVVDSMQELDGNKKVLKPECILCVSTQLIEAGVDISFACVVRALAGLDSIAQAAGRCNRNGEDPNGRDVFVVNLAEEDLSKLPDIQCGSDVTSRILGESADDLLSHTLMNRYYEEYFYKRRGQMDFPFSEGSIYDSLSHNNKGCGAFSNSDAKAQLPALRQAFRTAGEQFYAIEPNTTSVLVPYGRGAELVDKYSKARLQDKPGLLSEIGQYSVSLYPYQIQKLEKDRALHSIDDGIRVLDRGYYDPELGVVFQQNPEFLCV